jgi:hypothetical protein
VLRRRAAEGKRPFAKYNPCLMSWFRANLDFLAACPPGQICGSRFNAKAAHRHEDSGAAPYAGSCMVHGAQVSSRHGSEQRLVAEEWQPIIIARDVAMLGPAEAGLHTRAA